MSHYIRRREFAAMVGGIAVGAPLANAHQSARPPTGFASSALKQQFGFKGAVLNSADPGFDAAAFGGLWNKLLPRRHPQVIARVHDDEDVMAAVKFARASKMKVAIRGGGHNWCAPSVRNSGLLIDLTNLSRVVSVNKATRRAIVQPIVSNREIQAALTRIMHHI